MLKNLKVGIIISVATEVLREILELIFYGEIQLRTVDNIMYIMLVASLYTNYMLIVDLKEVKKEGKPMMKLDSIESISDKLKPCPFCGRKMVFHKETYTNKHGKYYMHEEYDINKEVTCILDDLYMPFVIGAGDATGNYIGEYAEKWNRRCDNDR